MTWRTHMAVGANAIWIIPFFSKIEQSIVQLLFVACIASLLPDIDALSAKIHYIGGGILGIFRGIFRGKYFYHRGIMHSIFITVIFMLILTIYFKDSYPALPFVFGLSYFSHPLIDSFNTGVGYFSPFSTKRYSWVPQILHTKVGGPVDTLLMFFGIFGLIIFFLTFQGRFFPHITG